MELEVGGVNAKLCLGSSNRRFEKIGKQGRSISRRSAQVEGAKLWIGRVACLKSQAGADMSIRGILVMHKARACES